MGERPGQSAAAVLSAATTVALLGLSVPARASAQDGVRSLDARRPVRVADAYPEELGAWEVQAGFRARWSRPRRGARASLVLEAGILRDLELGMGVKPRTGSDAEGGSRAGAGGLGFRGLYNLRRESRGWPAVALRVDVETPVGGELGREDWGGGAGLALTRSTAGRLRLHLNGGHFSGADADGGDFWTGGLAVDHPLGRSGRLLAGDVYVEVPVDAGSIRVWTEVGARIRVSDRGVLDAGLASRVDRWADGVENLELVVGFSRSFGGG